jgi:tol-pal system protein YbgF
MLPLLPLLTSFAVQSRAAIVSIIKLVSGVLIMRQHLLRATLLLSLAAILPMPRAHAASKEMVELQTQVQQLQDMLTQMKQSNDERLGVIINLLQQNTDNVNKMTATITQLQQALSAQNESGGGKIDQISGQLQSLNDSVDELKTRIGKLDAAMQGIQSQLQNTPANVPTGGSAPPQSPPGMAANPPAPSGGEMAGPPPAAQAPPLQQAYQSALRDYNAGKYAVAGSEFADVVHYYPQDDLAGNSQFYLGEIAYRQGKYAEAAKAYDAVLEQFPGNNKAPAAQLRKGESLLAINQRDAGIRELRSLIQRYPMTPEAQEGRSKLNGMGIRINPTAPAKPNAYAQ